MNLQPVDKAYLDDNIEYFSQVRREIFPFLPEKMGRVLEVGCGTGDTLGYIKQQGRCDWAGGIELVSSAAAIARGKVDLVIEGDIEAMELPFEEGSLDVILCLDILEHLVDPWRAVKKLDKVLKPGGILIASIPNVRHCRLVFPLLFQGKWQYRDSGILDKTHLRFFVRESAIALMGSSGLKVEAVRTTGLDLGSRGWIANLLTLGLFKSFFERQFLICARKAAPGRPS